MNIKKNVNRVQCTNLKCMCVSTHCICFKNADEINEKIFKKKGKQEISIELSNLIDLTVRLSSEVEATRVQRGSIYFHKSE